MSTILRLGMHNFLLAEGLEKPVRLKLPPGVRTHSSAHLCATERTAQFVAGFHTRTLLFLPTFAV